MREVHIADVLEPEPLVELVQAWAVLVAVQPEQRPTSRSDFPLDMVEQRRTHALTGMPSADGKTMHVARDVGRLTPEFGIGPIVERHRADDLRPSATSTS